MKNSMLRILVVWLAAAGMLHAGIWGGLASGLALCLGCEESARGGWTISAPCGEAPRVSCCDEMEISGFADLSAPRSSIEGCGCVDVPLPGGAEAHCLPVQRSGSADVLGALAPSVSGLLDWSRPLSEGRACLRRASPRGSGLPGDWGPVARRTVLVV